MLSQSKVLKSYFLSILIFTILTQHRSVCRHGEAIQFREKFSAEFDSKWNSLKVAFFQKVRFVFQISKSPKKNIPKRYPELEI